MEVQLRSSSKVGNKRLLVVSSILLSFVIGLPFWTKSTEIYRTRLPFAAIEDCAKHVLLSPLVFPCYFHFVVVERRSNGLNETHILEVLEEARIKISEILHANILERSSTYGGCGTSFVIMASLDAGNKCVRVGVPKHVPVFPCGLANSKLLELIDENDNDNEAVDEFLSKFLHKGFTQLDDGRLWENAASGFYTILSIKNPVNKNSPPSPGLGVTREGPPSVLKTVLGKYRHAWFVAAREDSLIADREIILMSDVVARFFMNGGKHHYSNQISIEEKGETLPIAADGKAIFSFSLLNAEPNDWIFNWNFNDLEMQFLAPVLEVLQPTALITVESQVLYHTPSATSSVWDSNLQKHVVLFETLPFFVNANEWHLDTSSAAAGRSKVLHFAIYIPAANECPLYLKHPDGSLSETNGFTSPGWGGVVILNPKNCHRDFNGSVQHLSMEDLKPVMDVIIAQIRVLFGLTSVTCVYDREDCVIIPAINTGFSDWELDILLRMRAIADMASFASTLRSLSHLVQSLPNMVIKEEIGDQVRSSLTAASEAERNASLGFYHAAAEAARNARSWAEEAFFQPSIMSLLYLPLEHHFAIYTPFFVPVLLHTILAVFKEMRRYRSLRKARLVMK